MICEGKSERAYMQELNRFLREQRIPLTFKAFDAHGGNPSCIRAALRHVIMQRRGRGRVFAMLDADIYWRDNEHLSSLPDNIIYLFNMWCFEDFLALHYDREMVEKWHESCVAEGHAEEPQHGPQVAARTRNILCHGYKKGRLPRHFSVSWETLYNLISNNGHHGRYLASDFPELIKCLLNRHYNKAYGK